jgi:hypothetical protein
VSPLREARDLEEARHIQHAIRRIQKRTILYSAVIAGAVSLFLGHAIEVDNNNKQAVRSRTNCQFLNDRIRVSGERLKEQSDNILGNAHHKPPISPFKFRGTPFEKFQTLIVNQAKQQRADARETLSGVKDCNKVFPKSKAFWFVG